jgi:hypothetical protein
VDVDPVELRRAADQVDAVVTASEADGLSLDLSGDVGHDGLAAAMTSFASSWEDGAGQLAEATRGIANGLRFSAATYELTDALAATGLGRLVDDLVGGP